jgi:dynein heavy chain
MPAGVDGVATDGDYSVILHKIEGIVIKWTHQVKSVLELKSGQALIDGKNPGPQEELKFWADLSSNLQCIYEQLSSPKVKKMGKILKEKDSSYFQSLVNMYDDVRIHLEEARDISMHLKVYYKSGKNAQEAPNQYNVSVA